MEVINYFIENYATIFELFGLVIVLFISAHVPKHIRSLTRAAALLLFVSMLITAFEWWTKTFETMSVWRAILTAGKYTINPLILVVLILLISRVWKPIPKLWFILLLIPLGISVPFYFSSQWTEWIFYVSEDNVFHHGILRYWPYVIFFFYVAIFVSLNFVYLRRYSLRNRFIALYITLGSTACVFIYLFTGKSDDYNPLLTSALVFYFLFMYIHMANIDSLTSLMNRQSYYQDVEDIGHKVTYVASIDMNDLKTINDNQGHHEGDTAIQTVAKIFQNNIGSHAFCYRVGGDEFVVLYIGVKDEQAVISSIEKIKDALKETPYTCAFGYARHLPGTSLEVSLKEADEKMYIDKAEIKSKRK